MIAEQAIETVAAAPTIAQIYASFPPRTSNGQDASTPTSSAWSPMASGTTNLYYELAGAYFIIAKAPVTRTVPPQTFRRVEIERHHGRAIKILGERQRQRRAQGALGAMAAAG